MLAVVGHGSRQHLGYSTQKKQCTLLFNNHMLAKTTERGHPHVTLLKTGIVCHHILT